MIHRFLIGDILHPLAGDAHRDNGYVQVLDARVGKRHPLVEKRRSLLFPLQDQPENRRRISDPAVRHCGIHQGAQREFLPYRLIPYNDAPGAQQMTAPVALQRKVPMAPFPSSGTTGIHDSPGEAEGEPPPFPRVESSQAVQIS